MPATFEVSSTGIADDDVSLLVRSRGETLLNQEAGCPCYRLPVQLLDLPCCRNGPTVWTGRYLGASVELTGRWSWRVTLTEHVGCGFAQIEAVSPTCLTPSQVEPLA